ncbi:MAG: Holliday junction branch migration protein RuvA [Chloroflexi bacterium]|nr:Holliday junction branch migration protein RuvA [Chloroflexota bacterium]|tara:strand:+ start:11789 stop:12373 length:585 start_codon:yes stop_codon:yes gene_type:complete
MVNTLISAVTGRLTSKGPEYLDIEVSGITLRISTPTTTVENVGDIGETIKILTSLQMRQDSITLYGFISENDRNAFDTLITISGVGPRLALAILSTFDAASLASAVSAENVNAFKSVSGVGTRTANRILLELKGKMEDSWSIPTDSTEVDDVFDSLTALGYSVQEAREAISSINSPDLTIEEKIRMALEHITNR